MVETCSVARPLRAAHSLPSHSPSPLESPHFACNLTLQEPLKTTFIFPFKKIKNKAGSLVKTLTIAVSAVFGSDSGPFFSPWSLSEVARDETTFSQLCRDPLLKHQLEPSIFLLGGPCPLSCSSALVKLISPTGRLNFKRNANDWSCDRKSWCFPMKLMWHQAV